MTHEIRISPANIRYTASSTTTLLDAALANRVSLQHSCKKGTCDTCSADVIHGLVKNEQGELVSAGTVLTCQSYAQSDVTLKANYYPELSNISCLTLPCKVAQKTFVTDDIILLTLRLPPTASFDYLPGQYIDLIYANVKRSYSIANACITPNGIELHIRIISDGTFSRLLTDAVVNQLMRLEGPKGTFFVKEATNPIIFLAGGTGFAPVKAMVEGLLAKGSTRSLHIYWGMSHSRSFYTDIASLWKTEHEHIHYIPVVSSQDDNWTGRRGLVHQAVLNDHTDLSQYHVYACGSSPMIHAAKEAFIRHGLDDDCFYSDAFVASN